MSLMVSIIIPSAGRRPELLQRAIKSALIDDELIQTEIIVILNGKDGMDFDLSQSFQHPLVSYHKIELGNVSKARNYPDETRNPRAEKYAEFTCKSRRPGVKSVAPGA